MEAVNLQSVDAHKLVGLHYRPRNKTNPPPLVDRRLGALEDRIDSVLVGDQAQQSHLRMPGRFDPHRW